MSAWLAEPLRRLGRVSAGPLLVRVSILVAAGAALLIAMPAQLMSRELLVGAALLALLPALLPASVLVTAVMLATIGLWLVDTVGFGNEVTFWRLFGLASALYLMHSSAALAAVLPYDAIVDAGVLGRWFARAALVLAAAAVLTLLLIEFLPGTTSPAGPTVMMLVGLAAVVGAVWLLSRLPRR